MVGGMWGTAFLFHRLSTTYSPRAAARLVAGSRWYREALFSPTYHLRPITYHSRPTAPYFSGLNRGSPLTIELNCVLKSLAFQPLA
jgi:hypothetical protein